MNAPTLVQVGAAPHELVVHAPHERAMVLPAPVLVDLVYVIAFVLQPPHEQSVIVVAHGAEQFVVTKSTYR